MNKTLLKANDINICSIHIDGTNYIVEDGIVEVDNIHVNRLIEHAFSVYIPDTTIKTKKVKK